jgi:hypothetical protein
MEDGMTMHHTMPARIARPLELARETVRLIGCGARPGYSCDGKGGFNVGRFADVRRSGLLPEERMAAVLAAAGDVFTTTTIIPAGAR